MGRRYDGGDDGAEPEATCPECGARVPDGAELCPGCGLAIEWEDAGFDCPQCGTMIEEGATRCPECGLAFAPPE